MTTLCDVNQRITRTSNSVTALAVGPAPALGLHLLMGANAREKFQNMLANLEDGTIAPVVMIARRTG